MKIQLVGNLNREVIEHELKHAQLVEEGDYLLYEKVERISVDDGYDIKFIPLHNVLYVESMNGTQSVHTAETIYHTKQSLKALELEPLFRINKSVLVNLNQIEDVKVKLNMRYSLKVKGHWLDVNRTYYNSFKERLGL